jgi:hypothetical protein
MAGGTVVHRRLPWVWGWCSEPWHEISKHVLAKCANIGKIIAMIR